MARAQVDPECETNPDGTVVGYDPEVWDSVYESKKQISFLNFYSVSMAYSPLHSPAPLSAGSFVPAIDLSYVPQLSCYERAVFYGTKTENTNKTPVLPRVRLTFGIGRGLYVGIAGIPPVTVFGVNSFMFGSELGYGTVLHEKLEVGGRLHALAGRVVGDLASAREGEEARDDEFLDLVYGIEASAGYRLTTGKRTLVPYLGLGFTGVRALMHVGEDGATAPGDDEYLNSLLLDGVNVEVGAQARLGALHVAAEAYMTPLPDFRFFFSPRVTVGYTFL